MRVATLVSPEKIVFSEESIPIIQDPNDMLIQVKKIGVCGSDIHAYHGKHPFTPLPVVQGHEYSGEVVAMGAEVTEFKVGDRVTGRPQQTCGTCSPCKSGRYNVCSNLKVEGFQAGGTAQDYFILPANRAYKIPQGIDYDQASLIEPAAVAAHATAMIKDIAIKTVVITGAGPIGNLIAQMARVRGAKRVVVTDFNAFRLGKLKTMGFNDLIDLSQESFEAGIARLLPDESFQVGIEAVGVEPALHNLINYIEKGGQVIIVGVYEEFPRLNMGFVGEHELTIQGSMMYKDEDYRFAIDCMNFGKVQVAPLITQRFPFEAYNEAYGFIEEHAKETIKVLIDVN